MPPNLARYLNKILFVSIPALFDDGTARPYTLIGAEMNGLWLQSEALTDRLLREDGRDLARMNPAVFVPFAQIAGVLVATSVPSPADECTPRTLPATATAATSARPPSKGEPAKLASPPKPPKRKRGH
ncbi:hypothetical protein PQR02_35985 [Paraburkholderia sediminicola]|uniref:Uncharacterized protein n=1 Tax=Paraburkholderia rhynchosiae TaxID=487049 RepID=A0ACC7NNI9_9BURK